MRVALLFESESTARTSNAYVPRLTGAGQYVLLGAPSRGPQSPYANASTDGVGPWYTSAFPLPEAGSVTIAAGLRSGTVNATLSAPGDPPIAKPLTVSGLGVRDTRRSVPRPAAGIATRRDNVVPQGLDRHQRPPRTGHVAQRPRFGRSGVRQQLRQRLGTDLSERPVGGVTGRGPSKGEAMVSQHTPAACCS